MTKSYLDISKDLRSLEIHLVKVVFCFRKKHDFILEMLNCCKGPSLNTALCGKPLPIGNGTGSSRIRRSARIVQNTVNQGARALHVSHRMLSLAQRNIAVRGGNVKHDTLRNNATVKTAGGFAFFVTSSHTTKPESGDGLATQCSI